MLWAHLVPLPKYHLPMQSITKATFFLWQRHQFRCSCIHCHPICYYLCTQDQINPFPHPVWALSLSLNRAPHHTTHAHIEHAHFWFVSISFTVSNILMKMRSTSSRTHQSSIYTVHIVIWQMLWEMWHDCSGTF